MSFMPIISTAASILLIFGGAGGSASPQGASSSSNASNLICSEVRTAAAAAGDVKPMTAKETCENEYNYNIDSCKKRFPGNTNTAKQDRAQCYSNAMRAYADCLKGAD
ncbi:hypothetical protein [Brevibacterium aurantiacum]|uniref:hypothetical protein n=2 Tax=Brevibacterium aurantiacum TaxID=273384 RepID=UPI00114412B4|nr:hypothetical protein [Brevibacterium aurantiacum]GEB23233.1 hypothetical protein BAU01nite_19660 [Brevibacterium aurantiacum]